MRANKLPTTLPNNRNLKKKNSKLLKSKYFYSRKNQIPTFSKSSRFQEKKVSCGPGPGDYTKITNIGMSKTAIA